MYNVQFTMEVREAHIPPSVAEHGDLLERAGDVIVSC